MAQEHLIPEVPPGRPDELPPDLPGPDIPPAGPEEVPAAEPEVPAESPPEIPAAPVPEQRCVGACGDDDSGRPPVAISTCHDSLSDLVG